MTGGTPVLGFDAVTRSFGDHGGTGGSSAYTAVRDVTMEVPAGRFVAVVGPSGCGKSTLLNMAAGLMTPTSGTVSVLGEPLRGINRRAGYLFQQDALLPWKTVLDNVALGPQLRGAGRAEREEQARVWVERVGLGRFADRFPFQLSGGMRKRVAVAQTWVVDPDVLLMDEPFSALDVQTRQMMENELLGLWTGSDKTVLFITHDLDEAIALADEVVVLSAGPGSHIIGRYPVELDRPRDLLSIRTRPDFVELFSTIWTVLREEVLASHERAQASAG